METLIRLFFASAVVVAALLYAFPEKFAGISIPGTLHADRSQQQESSSTMGTEENIAPPPSDETAEQNFEVDVSLADRVYTFSLVSSDAEHVVDRAASFCNSNGEALGFAPEALHSGCIAPIANNILYQIREGNTRIVTPATTEATLPNNLFEVEIPFNEEILRLTFDATLNSPFQVAHHFCIHKMGEMGLTETDVQDRCVIPYTNFVHEQLMSKGYRPPN